MEKVTNERVKQIADAVRIAVTDEEAEKYTTQIDSILKYSSMLSELNTDDVEPTTHGIVLKNILRDDVPKQSITQEEVLNNAPEAQDGHFKVPAIMD